MRIYKKLNRKGWDLEHNVKWINSRDKIFISQKNYARKCRIDSCICKIRDNFTQSEREQYMKGMLDG